MAKTMASCYRCVALAVVFMVVSLDILVTCSTVSDSKRALCLPEEMDLSRSSEQMDDPRCDALSYCSTDSQHTAATPPSDYYLHPGPSDTFKQRCFCDSLCSVYGDCCQDIEPLESDVVLPPETYTCESRDLLQLNVGAELVYVVRRCPAAWSGPRDVMEACEVITDGDLIQQVPITSPSGVLYANVYCALCHGIHSEDAVFWSLELECTKFHSFNSSDTVRSMIQNETLLHQGECVVNFSPPGHLSVTHRACTDVITRCPMDPPESPQDPCDVNHLCRHGITNYVFDAWGQTYKNIHCFMCNDVQGTPMPCFITSKPPPGVFGMPYPLSIVFDFNTGKGRWFDLELSGDGSGEVSWTCVDDHVYDPSSGVCRALTCRDGFELKGGRCMGIEPPNMEIEDAHSTNDCVRMALNRTEYELLENSSLLFLASHQLHEFGSYDLTANGQALVCSDLAQNFTGRVGFKFDSAQAVVSVVGQVVSLVGLFVLLVVYSLLPTLRNLAGKNLMSLSVSLFSAQLLFLVGSCAEDVYGACALIAILTHFSFLAAFAWMHIMAFDVWKTFSKTSAPSLIDNHRKKFLRYSLYGWGGPSLVIMVSVAVNFTVESSVRPAYGEGICWFTSRFGLLVFFALPVAMILFMNIIFYILTIIGIYKISVLSKMVANRSDKSRFWLYVKLSCLMGLTWLFGFVASAVDNQVLWYLFIIFNSLQGAFIFITFVMNKKVITLLKNRFRTISGHKHSSSTASSDTRTRSSNLNQMSNVELNDKLLIHYDTKPHSNVSDA